MERWKELQLSQLASAKEIDTAYQVALRFAKNIGYKFFEFSVAYKIRSEQLNTLRLNNYPASWNNEYEQKKVQGHRSDSSTLQSNNAAGALE